MQKDFRTLNDDLNTFTVALNARIPAGLPGIERIANLGIDVVDPVFKVRKFRCRSLKGRGSNSGLRLIYAYNPATDAVTFIEIYSKGTQENEDRERIVRFMKLGNRKQ